MASAEADKKFLAQALALAKQAGGWASPNPLVGAVIVKDGKIVGQGYYKKFGGPHAEIMALRQAKAAATGATMYVSLEPHSFFGKTPPCTDAIIRAGIKRVVCCTLDPNPKVAGAGVKQLRAAGVKVFVGLLSKEARELNETFMHFQTHRRPFVAVKFAASLDGKIATRTNDSKWISCEAARKFARSLRGYYQAVLVGASTVIHDNPHLGVRVRGARDPLRVILDARLRVPPDAQVFRDRNALVAVGESAPAKKIAEFSERGIEVLRFSGQTVPLPKLLAALAGRQVVSLLVEGGGTVIGRFADLGLIDKVYVIHAPIIVGGDDAVSAVRGRGV
ncbi:MAG: bifunctional diaminohydroxyphosphoribosylaminopyrimidine deaminase/5-amino-6-(5-phosphoribosylamino)uracil reductase RibD, partial [Patescibacteria group bacterium]|nr:bifunctional diaminohydroxyphosphoribosylaminopyrimidine deaminase/5-amino-6-(5-phosphoribosylamino)uracil reductase RibD [Patescibacteria group bacterium]